MTEKLASIIMPAYNAQKYIAESIESVLAQTYQNWELIIADNNSTDKTAEIIASYFKDEERIKYISANNKQGAAYARNTAIEKAQGSYIAFLDSDDLWLPEKLERHINFIQQENLVLSYTPYKTFGSKQAVIKSAEQVNFKQLLKHNVIGCSTAIYNLELLKEKFYMPDIKIGEDWCLWADILKNTDSTAKALPEYLTNYRVDANSLSANKAEAAYYHYWILRNHFKLNIFASIYNFTEYALLHIKRIVKNKLNNK